MVTAKSNPISPLLSISDVASVLNVGRRTLERMIAASEFPSPDLRIGKMPRWRQETLNAWIVDPRRIA